MFKREREFDLQAFTGLLKSRSILIFGIAVILGAFLTLVALAGDPVYEANGSVQIADQGAGIGLAGEFFTLGGGSSMINSEVEIVRSRSIAYAVIEETDLRLGIEDVTYGNPLKKAFMFVFADRLKRGLRSLRVDAVEFPQENIDTTFTLSFTDDSGNFRVSGPTGELGTGRQGELFESDGLTFIAAEMHGPAGTRFHLTPRSAFETLRSYRERLKVSTLGGAQRTNLISIDYRDTNPSLAADVVNAIIAEYEHRDTEWRAGMGETQTEMLESRVAEALTNLQIAENALAEYKNEFGVVSLPDEARLAISDLSRREAERIDVDLRLSLLQGIHRDLASSMHEDTFAVPPSLTSDSVIQQLAADHARLMIELDNLLLDYTEAHPAIIAKREAIQSVRENILEALSATIGGLVGQRMDLAGVVSTMEQRLYSIPGVERDLLELARNVDVADGAYRLLIRRLDESRLVEASFTIGNRIIDDALPPARPVAPSIRRNLAMGLGIGFILGILLAFLVEILDPRLRRPDQLAAILNGSPLAVVSRGDRVEISRAASTLALAMLKTEKPVFALVRPGPDSPHLRELMESVLHELALGAQPVLLVDTSTAGIEGFFGADQSPGIAEIAMGQSVKPQEFENGRILVLPAGDMPSSAHVTSREVRERVADLAGKAALTLYYTADISEDPALRGWTAMSSGAVLIPQRNRDSQSDISATFDALECDGTPILAALLFD